MSDERRKPGYAFCSTVLVIAILLYVLSSGPTRMMGVRLVPLASGMMFIDSDTTFISGLPVIDDWWLQLYFPLRGLSRESWGAAPLLWYWRQFPMWAEDGKWYWSTQ